ncbi:hypothetical protein [Paenibacillus harenae]|uniref:DUF4115 domain-containing protein n=1 Tax=Paenibacillus harenae TaxID=306543 RepID=A0ABT9U0Z6_PAEHA|nr:hypothetical protein [Paenibacillus harenae]MDQ0060104.1 hypothetical protein [Paenibacillus harenae]MDQ0112345.1 hypothetical protein [Paenibacillus harenae]
MKYKQRKQSRQLNTTKWSSGTTNVHVKQGANATINQGGNAFAINASEIGVVRIRPGSQNVPTRS